MLIITYFYFSPSFSILYFPNENNFVPFQLRQNQENMSISKALYVHKLQKFINYMLPYALLNCTTFRIFCYVIYLLLFIFGKYLRSIFNFHVHFTAYNCSSLQVVFTVARNYGFYFMNYYLPSLLIVAVSWVTFWEAPDAAPGRCLLGNYFL